MVKRVGAGLVLAALFALPAAAQESRPTVDAASQVNNVVLHVDGMS